MQEQVISSDSASHRYNPRFLEFIKLFDLIDVHEKLFPKECRACGKVYTSLCEYIIATIPKAHSLDDGENVMGRPWTMMYRHCGCGNTLVVTFTDETFPLLDRLWSMLRKEAEDSGKPLLDVVLDFVTQWERYCVNR